MRRRDFGKVAICGLAAGTLCGLGASPGVALAAEMDQTMAFYARSSTDRGLRFLRANQSPDGSWAGTTGITALALQAFVTSYQRYEPGDGPFVTKPIERLVEALRDTGGAGLSVRETAQAVSALRMVEDAEQLDLIQGVQEALASEEVGTGDTSVAAMQVDAYLALTALRGSQTPATEKFRSRAYDAVAPLQLSTGGFPGPRGSESFALTCASAASLALALQNRGEGVLDAALDRAVTTYEPAPAPEDAIDLAFFLYEVLPTAMKTAERRSMDRTMGAAGNWRDTMAYALIERQSDDGGWLPKAPESDRFAATARAVVAMNTALAW